MSIPKHKAWQDLKKKYGVGDGAVSGVNVGAELDRYWKANNAKEQMAALVSLEAKLNTYITKLDKKKVKQYPQFQKEFLNEYLGEAHHLKEDLKRYSATADIYRKELAKFFTAVQKLDKKKSTAADLQKFRSGPVRGLTAMGKQAQGVDTKEIDAWLGTINDAVQKLPSAPSAAELEAFVTATVKTAEKIAKIARQQKLV